MPPCLLAIAGSRASADLPFLPFLAPRLFAATAAAPWSYGRRGVSNFVGSGLTEGGKEMEGSGMTGEGLSEARGARRRNMGHEQYSNAGRGRLRGARQLSRTQKMAQSSSGYQPLYSEISNFCRSRLRMRRVGAVTGLSQHKTATQRRQDESNNDSEEYAVGRYVKQIFANWLPSLDKSQRQSGRRKRHVSSAFPRAPFYTGHPHYADILLNRQAITNTFTSRTKSYRRIARRFAPGSKVKVSFTDGTDPIGSWAKGFAILSYAHDKFAQHGSHPVLDLDSQCARWADPFQDTRLSPKTRERVWRNLRRKRRLLMWPGILLYLLKLDSTRAFDFLKMSYSHPYPPSVIAVDALEYIATLYDAQLKKANLSNVEDQKQKWRARQSELFSTFWSYIRQGRPPFIATISQHLLNHIIRICPDDRLKDLYVDLISYGVRLHPKTINAFTARFAKTGEYELGLETLGKSVELGHNPLESGFIKLSSAVLRSSAMDGKSYHATAGIVARLLELGVSFDTQLYNIIICNAVEARDFETAWRIYNLLESGEAGLKPTGHTLGILLWGLKHDDNPSKHQDFANYCAERALQWRDSWLATEYLHYTYVCNKGANPDEVFRRLRREYCRFFDVQPLIDLDILPYRWPQACDPLRPGPPAIEFIVNTFLNMMADGTDDSIIHGLYKNFRNHIYAGHPIIGPLAEDCNIHNAFLLAFSARSALIKQSPSIIRDMATPLPHTAWHALENRPLRQVAPDAVTWSIFSHGFVKAGQMAAAEKVIDLMRKRNIVPRDITWASLLNGYARAQNVGKVAEVYGNLQRTPEEARERSEEVQRSYALHSLGKIKDRKALIRALRGEIEKDGGLKEGDK